MTEPEVSVVIPCFDRLSLLERTLRACFTQELPGVAWEIVVADNHPGRLAAPLVAGLDSPVPLRHVDENRGLILLAHVAQHGTDQRADRARDVGVQRRVLPQQGGEQRGAGARQAGDEVYAVMQMDRLGRDMRKMLATAADARGRRLSLWSSDVRWRPPMSRH